jgi:Uma2 family endonuclease
MATALKLPNELSEDVYLSDENVQFQRHEFVAGFVYAMAGASEGHADIKLNIAAWLKSRVPKGCRVFDGDLKLRIEAGSSVHFYYPDIFVSCGPRDRTQLFRTDATLVIEILSPTTQRTDRGEKSTVYGNVPSLEEYVLVSQDRAQVEVRRRKSDWVPEHYDLADTIELTSIHQQLPVAVIYDEIEF